MKFPGEPGGGVSERNSFGFQGGQFVEGGRQCVVVDVDKVHGGWIYRKGEAGHSVSYAGGEKLDRWI